MGRIFGESSDYSEETQNELKQVMLCRNRTGLIFLSMEKREWAKKGGLSLMHGSQDLRKAQKENKCLFLRMAAENT